MNCRKQIIILLSIFPIFFIGCENIIPNSLSNLPNSEMPVISSVVPARGWIVVENDAGTIKDCTPSLSIYSEGANYMSFSGDGIIWTNWVEYNIYYDKFDIANGLNGTKFGSGIKYVYVRFKDKQDNLSPLNDLAFDTIEYEMGDLFSIKISPKEVTIPVKGACFFSIHAYDIESNEVPLDGLKITWTKSCNVGELSPTTGLSTTYTAPSIPGKRNITAHYNKLGTDAIIEVTEDN